MPRKTTEIKKFPRSASNNKFTRTNNSPPKTALQLVPFDPETTPFRRLIYQWLDYCRAGDLSPKTIEDYNEIIRKFWWWWNEHTGYVHSLGPHPKFVTTKEAREFAAYLREPSDSRWGVSDAKRMSRLLSPVSVKTYGRSVKVFFNWLEQEGYIEHNPFNRSVKFGSRQKQDRVVKMVEAEDLGKIFSFLSKPENLRTYEGCRDLAIISLLLDSGIRRGELLSMTLGNLNLEGDRATIEGKTGRRWALFSDMCRSAVLDYLQRFRRQQNPDPDSPLWLCNDGEPISYDGFSSLIRRIKLRSGVNFHAHKLRHTFASLMARQGTNVFDLKSLLGHTSITTTQIYVHDNVDHLSKVHRPYSPLNFLVQSQVKGVGTTRRRRGRPRLQR